MPILCPFGVYFFVSLLEGIIMSSKVTGRTFSVAPDEPCKENLYRSKPRREYTGFDRVLYRRRIDYPNRIAIVRSGSVGMTGFEDIFALDNSPTDPKVYEHACRELDRFCRESSDTISATKIIGFYDLSPNGFDPLGC